MVGDNFEQRHNVFKPNSANIRYGFGFNDEQA